MDTLVCRTRKEVSKAVRAKKKFVLSTSITKLKLDHVKIGASGVSTLCDSLISNSTLTALKICSSAIGDSCAIALSDALKSNSTLLELYIYIEF